MDNGNTAGATVHGLLDDAARGHPDVTATFHSESTAISYRELAESARRMASGLAAHGVRPGDPVGILCPNAPDFLQALFAANMAGAAACPLPLPMGLRTVGAYLDRLARITEACRMRTLVVSDRFGALATRLAQALPALELISVRAVLGSATTDAVLPTVGPDDVAVVQFTSGSTALPKGVRLTHRNVLAGLDAIKLGIELGPHDGGGFWLPLFHDMGLFGTMSAVLTGIPAHVWSPAAFVKSPAQWLRQFLDSGATISAMPNFGYDYLVAAFSPDEAGALDMAHWRVAFNGAEPIAEPSVAAFLDRFAPGGFRAEAMFGVYGMAEATLAVTFPPLGRPPLFEWVDRDRLARTGQAVHVPRDAPGSRAVAGVGRAVAGMRLRIVDPDTGMPTADGTVGEIQIQGDSVTAGYLEADPSAVQPAVAGGWLCTGDLAYQRGGEVFVTGRAKEMIIARGTNFYPEDVETVARRVDGVYKGRCVAVAGPDPAVEEMLLVAETELAGAAASQLSTDLRLRVAAELGLAEIVVHLVAPRSIPRTSSGKFQRLAARELVSRDVSATLR